MEGDGMEITMHPFHLYTFDPYASTTPAPPHPVPGWGGASSTDTMYWHKGQRCTSEMDATTSPFQTPLVSLYRPWGSPSPSTKWMGKGCLLDSIGILMGFGMVKW